MPSESLAAQLRALDACGRRAAPCPGSATATVSPAPKFQAPHTIWRGSASPTSTWQSCRRSAFGCLPASSTSPATISSSTPSCVGQAAALDALDLVAGEREPRGELVERRQLGEVVGQPLQRDLHRTAPAELLEEAHVVVVEALARAGCRTCSIATRSMPMPNAQPDHDLGVVAVDEAEHVRVDHAGAEDLDPALALAHAAAAAAAQEAGDVELDARLGEREEVRSAGGISRSGPKSARAKCSSVPLRCAEREPAVDGEALDLLEHAASAWGRARRGGRRGRGRSRRRAAAADSIDAHLHRRGLRAQARRRARSRACPTRPSTGWSSGVLSAVKL